MSHFHEAREDLLASEIALQVFHLSRGSGLGQDCYWAECFAAEQETAARMERSEVSMVEWE